MANTWSLGQAEIADKEGNHYLAMSADEAVKLMTRDGAEMVLENSVRRDVVAIKSHYDNWFSERSLYQESSVRARSRHHPARRQWPISWPTVRCGSMLSFGRRQRGGHPLQRAAGSFCLRHSYHYNKFVQRGFDWVIDI